ncbi:spore germination protein [Peribacillus muralis]|uniref:spore germination protein n=1 Tax=Peribacillus muralis TaxID=264697 RepID=UPI00366ED434
MKTDLHLNQLATNENVIPEKLVDKNCVLNEIYKNCEDAVFHPICINNISFLLLYFSGLADESKLNQDIIRPLLQSGETSLTLEEISTHITNVSNTKMIHSTLEMIQVQLLHWQVNFIRI